MRREAVCAAMVVALLACTRQKAPHARITYRVAGDSAATDATVRVLQKRLDRAPIASQVAREGPNVTVDIESAADVERARKLIGEPGRLEFMLLDDKEQPVRPAPLTNDHVADAVVADGSFVGSDGSPEASVTLTPDGERIMAQLSEANIGKKLAVVLDGRIVSAPIITSKLGGRLQITLGAKGTPAEQREQAHSLVLALRTGALPAPLEEIRMENK